MSDTGDVERQVEVFLQANFPQIKMHGGSFEIEDWDEESGVVAIELQDACSGCGISPMTIEAIKRRLPESVPAVNRVDAGTANTSDDVTSGPL